VIEELYSGQLRKNQPLGGIGQKEFGFGNTTEKIQFHEYQYIK
jgi:hypothetical protein